MPKESSPGYLRHIIPVHVTGAGLSGTGQVILIDSLALGFRFWLEKLLWITQDTLVGAGGVQTFNVRKGDETGTVLLTVAPAIATEATIGTVLSDAPVAGTEDAAMHFGDSDTLTVERAASGTAFSAGTGQLLLVLRERAQAR